MKHLSLALCLLMAGCASTTALPLATAVASTEEVSASDNHTPAAVITPERTRILRYYVDPVHKGQAAAIVSGAWHWQKGCLYLINSGNMYSARFPELPEDSVAWDEDAQILTLTSPDHKMIQTFALGDYIVTNGYFTDYDPKVFIPDNPEDVKCLAPSAGIANVGTWGMEKFERRKP